MPNAADIYNVILCIRLDIASSSLFVIRRARQDETKLTITYKGKKRLHYFLNYSILAFEAFSRVLQIEK